MRARGACDPSSILGTLKCMTKVKTICSFCGKVFFRRVGRFNEARKFGWNQYCSRKCQNQAKVTRIEKICANPNCNKKVSRELAQLRKSKSGRIFCSSSCAAIVNNPKTGLKRRKIKICPICGKQFFGHRKYCSTGCRPKPPGLPLGYQRVTKKQIINETKEFYKHKGRIPLREEFYHRKAAWLRFGTWNKVVEAAGFKPNPVLFAEKHIANDGHKCDSVAEKIIDDWFYARKIKHKRAVPYPENSSLTADFVTKNNWIEFFGLAGEIKDYDRLLKKKQILAKKYKLPFIEIYPKDLFPINRLSEIIKIKNKEI